MIEAFIFDVDGTLIDSNDFHAEAWCKAFEKYGKDFSFEKSARKSAKARTRFCRSF
jgi:beta-phosphoglucomutase-like phosphatase (HAD superfamily)